MRDSDKKDLETIKKIGRQRGVREPTKQELRDRLQRVEEERDKIKWYLQDQRDAMREIANNTPMNAWVQALEDWADEIDALLNDLESTGEDDA